MRISIIIPVYNVAQYIVRCMDSVASQTYVGEIECLLVDDCGPDNSAQICKDYLERYSGPVEFRFIQRVQNGGLSAARNTGIQEASGDYIYFLDSDDELPSNSMELLAEEVYKHPEVDVVMGFMFDDKHSDYYNLDCFKNHQYTTDKAWLQYSTFNRNKVIPANGCNKLIRRQFIFDHQLFFKPGIIHEDEHWMFYLVKYVESWSFVFEPTYIRYWNEGSIMTSRSREKEADNWFKIMLDHSSNFYGPYKRLQLLKYMDMYFNRWIFEFHYPGYLRLHYNFIKANIGVKQWKGALLLTVWSLFYGIRDGFRLKRWLMEYSASKFEVETKKGYEKL